MKKLDFPKSNDNSIGYSIFLPTDYSLDTKTPMIVFLHGAGERGNGSTELEKATAAGLSAHLKSGAITVPAIVLCPQCPQNMVWNHFIFDLHALILNVAKEYNADFKKISITGLSMGGFGTWEMGMQFPSTFSAMAPICGGGMAWRTNALKGKPIWAFHGDADNVVDISNSNDMVSAARKNGAIVKYTIFSQVMHNSWDPAYLDTKVLEWLINQSL